MAASSTRALSRLMFVRLVGAVAMSTAYTCGASTHTHGRVRSLRPWRRRHRAGADESPPIRAVQVRDDDAEDARAVAKRGLPVKVADAGMDQFQIRNRGGGASASRADNGAFLSKRGVTRRWRETYLTSGAFPGCVRSRGPAQGVT